MNSGGPITINSLPNELIVRILAYISEPADVWAFLMTQVRWFKLGIDTVWMRPAIISPRTMYRLTAALESDAQSYATLIRRLNFAAVSHHVTGDVLRSFAVCTNLERLALAGATFDDESALRQLISSNPHLSSLDLSGVACVSDTTVLQAAKSCPNLHGIYFAGCSQVTDLSIDVLTRSCNHLRRLKFSDTRATSAAVYGVLDNCPNILELDVGGIPLENHDVRQILLRLSLLRDLRLSGNCHITNSVLDGVSACPNLRVVDLGGCNIGDNVVGHLVKLAPRLHQVSLGKCYNLTDHTLDHLGELGSSLFYVHLGHCHNITDMGVANLVRRCPKLQYIDVANCCLLTNTAVLHISRLARLRRVGLVKCVNIDDVGISYLARKPLFGINVLERVHLSYCSNITLQAIINLVNNCPKLTHLSLTGVTAFLRPDLAQFCRAPPPELTQHQQATFCVYSGSGITKLREYVNRQPFNAFKLDSEPPNMMPPELP